MSAPSAVEVKFRWRFVRRGEAALGPGKMELLAAIAETGPISAAARSLGMSYRRTWRLVDTMNAALRSPAVDTTNGGGAGRRKRVDRDGEKRFAASPRITAHYRAADAAARAVAEQNIRLLMQWLAP